MSTVLLIGNPRPGSRTRALAETVARALDEPGGRELLELGDIVGVTFGPEPVSGGNGVADPFAVVRGARLLVVATPSYKGSYTGLLKVFLDQFAAGDLSGAVAVPVAVAASPAHRDATAAALAALLGELGANLPAPPVALLEPELAAAADRVAEWAGQHAPAIAKALAEAA